MNKKPKLLVPRRKGVIFPDIHFPFHHKLKLAVAIHLCILLNPDWVMQIGDLWDMYSAAKFPRSHNLFTPRDENKWCEYYSEFFWGTIHEKLPLAEKHQLLGNHCVRPIKRIMELAPAFEDEMVEALKQKYTYDNVKTVYDSREELIIEDVAYIHGWASKLGGHLDLNKKSVVHGHTHKGGIIYKPMFGDQLFEMDCGYLADPLSKGLGYTMQKRATHWTHGIGYIDESGPRFISIDDKLAQSMKDDPFIKNLIKSL